MENEMQNKLEQYRLRKRRKQKFDEIKSKFKNFLMLGTGTTDKILNDETKIQVEVSIRRTQDKYKVDISTFTAGCEEELLVPINEEQTTSESKLNQVLATESQKENKIFKYTLWLVYFLFWITLYIIAIELKFGLVFLMFSALFGIYFNTRTGPKKTNEISAYSVFNENCESIDGTLKAEQFEREMRYGAGSVK